MNEDYDINNQAPESDAVKSNNNDEQFLMSKQLNISERYAGFWMRFWAYLLDLIVVGSLVRIIVNPTFRLLDLPLNSNFSTVKILAPITIASALIFYGYFVLMTLFLGQTVGKMVFGLKVISLKDEKLTLTTILFREWIGRFISATTWIGYLVVAFFPKKQGLHDLFSDTTVIHER